MKFKNRMNNASSQSQFNLQFRNSIKYHLLNAVKTFRAKKAIRLCIVEQGSINILSSSKWDLLRDITNTLKFFYKAIFDLLGNNACIFIVMLIKYFLNKKFQSQDDTNLN